MKVPGYIDGTLGLTYNVPSTMFPKITTTLSLSIFPIVLFPKSQRSRLRLRLFGGTPENLSCAFLCSYFVYTVPGSFLLNPTKMRGENERFIFFKTKERSCIFI